MLISALKRMRATFIPAVEPYGYPFDLNGSLRYTRPKTGIDYFPSPSVIGMVSGLCPQQNAFVWEQAFGKKPSGPNVNEIPVNLQWQTIVPGLTKNGG